MALPSTTASCFPSEEIGEDSNLENITVCDDDEEPKSPARGDDDDGDVSPPKLFPIFQKNFRPKENQLKSVQLELEKATPPRKKMKTMLTKETNGLTQMVLDAGQKNIGPKLCEECNLLYSPGDFDDEEEHRKAHVRIQNTFKLTLWKDAKIVYHYPEDTCQIIMVQAATDASRVKTRLRDFLAWLDSELGAGYDPSGTKKSERIFLYASRTTRKNVVRILGCGIMELPDASKIITSPLVKERLLPSPTSVDAESTTSEQSSSSQYDQNHSKVFIGITRLWTDPGFRQRNIASKVCDAMRFNSGILGHIVAKENFGILEPSQSGTAFMTKFTGGRGAMYTYTCI